jgi:hypothetical protein
VEELGVRAAVAVADHKVTAVAVAGFMGVVEVE